MKQFYRKFVIFILPIVVLLYPLDCLLSFYLKQSHKSAGEFEVWNDIYSGAAACNLAIYGSSRAWVQIDSQILLDSLDLVTYNFGMDGQNFHLQYLRHLEFLSNNYKPNHILLSVDMSSLVKKQDLYNLDQFLPYMLWNKNIELYTSKYNGFNYYDYHIPLIRYSGTHKSYKEIFAIIANNNNSEKLRRNGFHGMDIEWDNKNENAKNRASFNEKKIDNELILLLELFIVDCLEKGINLTLVYAPEYIEGQSFTSNRNEIINVYNDITSKYNLNFYNYSNDSICLDKSLFYNYTHLNAEGASLFSQKLAHDIKGEL